MNSVDEVTVRENRQGSDMFAQATPQDGTAGTSPEPAPTGETVQTSPDSNVPSSEALSLPEEQTSSPDAQTSPQAQTSTDDAGLAEPNGAADVDQPAAVPESAAPLQTTAETTDQSAAGDLSALFDPMHQFEIKRLVPLDFFGLDASFTNSSLMMVIGISLVSFFLISSMRGRALVPDRMQSLAEVSYEFVANMVRANAGSEGMRYFPFIFTLFFYILTMNMLGMFPYAFTVTSHIIVTVALALMVFIGVTVIGIMKNGTKFIGLFVPSGVPVWLLPLLVPIEILSYLVRPFSLSVRLFANMMAGHTMLKVFAGFVVMLGVSGGWAPLLFMVAVTGLEILIAFLQAFVFAVLSCIYLNDALHPEH
jgi:F-type H+-transporting ATPase subunit a